MFADETGPMNEPYCGCCVWPITDYKSDRYDCFRVFEFSSKHICIKYLLNFAGLITNDVTKIQNNFYWNIKISLIF